MSNVIKLNHKAGTVRVKFNEDFVEEEETSEEQTITQQQQEYYLQQQLKSYYERGLQEGQKALRAELEKEFTARLVKTTEEFNNILSGIEQNLSTYEEAFDSIVTEVAIDIAEKIVRREIQREQIITGTLKEAVRKILGANEVMIKLNPADYQVLISAGQNAFLEEAFSKIKFEQDEKIEPGGCFVESEIGNVDARLSTQLGEVRRALEAAFGNTVV